jgi:signal transduction histidine kinase
LEPRFQDIGDDVDELIQINRQGAERQVQDILLLQHSVAELQNILSIAGTAVILIVGGWAIRLIGHREDQLVGNSAILEMRNRDLDAFAGRVAHDLRNPLNTINLASVKLATVCSDDQAVAILQRSVNRMDALIKDMLLLSRAGAESGDVCDPAKAAAEINDDLSLRLTREGGTMHVSVAPAKIRGSEGLLRQALWNLVDNAVKYRRPEVPVHVEVTGRSRREFYELSVSDNGMGMAPDESSKVFEPLYRAPGTRMVPGTGLGLSIVKRVVEASGGTVSVSSKIGQGTAFIINLPIVDDNS